MSRCLSFGLWANVMKGVYMSKAGLKLALRTLLGYITLVALQIAVMVWGWGLKPESWGVILGLGVVAPLLTRLWVQQEVLDMQKLSSTGGIDGLGEREDRDE